PSSCFYLAGFPVNVTVPANSVLSISTDGGVQTTSTLTAGFSVVDVGIAVDGLLPGSATVRRLEISNTTSLTQQFENWSMSRAVSLSAGSHTIGVCAALVSGSPATAGGSASSVLQAQLTIVTVKR